jgi:hypothetical protein
MSVLTTGPQWFGGYDILFNVIFAIVTLLIAGLSYRARHLTKEKKYSYFGLAFLLIGIAHIIFVIFAALQNTALANVLLVFDFVFLIHMFLMLLAYFILILVILKIENKNAIALLLALLLLFVLFSYQYFIKFHIISFVLLAFLTWQFFQNYKVKKNINSKFVYISFFLLTCSHIFFAGIRASDAVYVAGEIFQLLGFILLFLVFAKVVTHGRKKRKA